MHKTICMQSIEHISMWEVFSSICPKEFVSAVSFENLLFTILPGHI